MSPKQDLKLPPRSAPLSQPGLTACYDHSVIRTFADAETEALYHSLPIRRLPPEIRRTARRKLLLVNEARLLTDLRAPPGNRLEALLGDRRGQHSIRTNDQWRICFRWHNNDAFEVEIVDYH